MHISWGYSSHCFNEVKNSRFINGVGLFKGGAIVYSSYKPSLINNYFENNTAPFRPNIGNYVIRLMILSNNSLINIKDINNVSSGTQINNNITFAVVNNEGNIDDSDNKSSIRILPIDSETDVEGQTTVVVKNGIATFSNTIFVGTPGKNNVKYELKTSAINYNAMEYLNPEYSIPQTLTVSFGWWKPGEYQYKNKWISCGVGSYSVIWNETECHNCPNNAACQGSSISLNSGYWRMDRNSTDIIEWPNEDAWLGGYNETSTYPVFWADGYEGLLWNECITVGNEKYERISDNQWSKCPDPSLNFLRIVGFGVLVLIFLIIMIL